MQQQHLMQMQPMMAAYYPNNVTTDHIQQYLDENKSLILKIVESQNSGKLTECAENQSRLQRNLMYLAAIADSQPQPPTMPGQYPSSGMMQQGGHYMQAQQAQQMTQQQLMAARSSLLYAQQLQQQHALQSQLGMNSSGSQGLHMMHNEGTTNVGGFPDFGRLSTGDGMHGSGKQDIGSAGDGRGGSSSGHSGDGGETLYLKSSGDGN
ncbi:GRF1-interacting factor 1-like [Vicia villosa]|uniref:GRF1-interacting factor 1-like n=1 Tax=Vicia villosa TaxID=3911 RepID=UPI00273C58AB|nr:GRF1-interacting factor 1-like [Vicia villosa]